MKKTFFALCFLLASYISLAQNQGNYIVIINNDSIRIDLDKSFLYEPSKGKPLQITITQPNTLTYSDDMISFE